MNTKQFKIILVALAEKIEDQERELRIKEYVINDLQRKLKDYEEREE